MPSNRIDPNNYVFALFNALGCAKTAQSTNKMNSVSTNPPKKTFAISCVGLFLHTYVNLPAQDLQYFFLRILRDIGPFKAEQNTIVLLNNTNLLHEQRFT